MSQRTIQYVLDCDIQITVHVSKILDSSESDLHKNRTKCVSRHKAGKDKYLCTKCLGPVWPAIDKGKYFKHFSPVDFTCEWYTGKANELKELNASRYKNTFESPLHRRLKQFIFDRASHDDRFEWVLPDKKYIVDDVSKDRRKPDVYAKFHDHEVAIELQLSRTYLYDVVGREDFYYPRDIKLLWVFSNFEGFKNLAIARDIFHTNYANAFELDTEAEKLSLELGRLMLKVHWQGYHECSPNKFQFGWSCELIDLKQLRWNEDHPTLYFVIPDEVEFLKIRSNHSDWFKKFEAAWLRRYEKTDLWRYRASQRAWDKFRELLPHRNLISFDEAHETGIDKAIDQMFALRNGNLHYGKQNKVAAVNQILEFKHIFTNVIVAGMKAYSHQDLLTTTSVCQKIENNKQHLYSYDRQQLSSIEAVIKLLFPEIIRHVT